MCSKCTRNTSNALKTNGIQFLDRNVISLCPTKSKIQTSAISCLHLNTVVNNWLNLGLRCQVGIRLNLIPSRCAQKSPKPCQSLGLTVQIDVYDDSTTSSSPFVHPNGSKHEFWANLTLARSNLTLNVRLAKASLRSRDTERYYPRYSYMLPT